MFNAELSPRKYWLGPRSQEVGEEAGRLYLSLPCHHQNHSCIKIGSDESHLNVSFTVKDKVTKAVSTDLLNFADDDELMLNVFRCQLTY